jgi:hypothetical protein
MNDPDLIPNQIPGQERVLPLQPDGRISIRKIPSKTMTVSQLIKHLSAPSWMHDFPVVVEIGELRVKPVLSVGAGFLDGDYGPCVVLHLENVITPQGSP